MTKKADLNVPDERDAQRMKPAEHVVWHPGQVTGAERALLLTQRPATLWLTGLSGAGKSTIACALERRLLPETPAAASQ